MQKKALRIVSNVGYVHTNDFSLKLQTLKCMDVVDLKKNHANYVQS